jgi:hypothetical protein
MNHLKKILFLVCCLSAATLSAQVTGLSIETYYVDNNSIPGYPDGHTTYRIFANCTNPTDVVSTVYGDVYAPLSISVTNGSIWNTGLGGSTGPAINQAFCAIFGEVCYDSFVTIGRENLADPGGTIFTLESAGQPWISNFAGANAGASFVLNDDVGGAWFGLPGEVNCFADANLQVLIAQITTAGNLTVSLNLQVFPNWQSAGDPYETQTGLFATTGAVEGCTDPAACNFDPTANSNDGSCDYSCYGCTEPTACNYDSEATLDDGSCDYSCYGCTDPTACNFNPEVTLNDGSCTYPGCIDVNACNYDPTAGCSDGSCTYGCAGCMDPTACNYNAGATTDDGSCDFSCYGCTDSESCNFDASATIDDGSCVYTCIGCTDMDALNYEADNTIDNGTCLYDCMLNDMITEVVDPSCEYTSNGSIYIHMMGAQGDYLYSFNGGPFINYGMEQTYSSLPNGTYTVVVRDSRFDDLTIDPNDVYGSCTVTLSFTLDATGVEFCENMVTNVSCPGESDGTAMDMCWTGGNGLVGFSIYNASTNQPLMDGEGDPIILSSPNYSELSAGAYYWVAVDQSLCSYNSSIFTITEPLAFEFGMLMTEATSCSDSNDGCASAMITSGGVGPITYNLYNSSNNSLEIDGLDSPSTCDLFAGTYYWIAVDANGCMFNSDDFTISAPDALSFCEISTTDVSCNLGGDGCASAACVTGGTEPYMFNIVDAESNEPMIIGLSFADHCGLVAGTYYFEVMDANGCMANSEQFTINQPEPINAVASTVGATCNGSTDGSITIVYVGENGPIECSIDGGETWSTDCVYTDLGAGNYTLQVMDMNGCILQFDAAITEPQVLTSEATATDVACSGDQNGSVNITAEGGTAPYTYTLDGESNETGDFGDLAPNNYSYTVVDANGCEATGSVMVNDASPIVITVDGSGGDGGSDEGFINVTVEGGTGDYDYLWTDEDGNEYVTEDLSGLSDGNYTLCVTDGNDCEACISEPIEITIGISELNAHFSLTANPNPSNGLFRLDFSGLTGERVEIVIHDATGRLVYSEDLGNISGEQVKTLDLTEYTSGIYQMTVLSNGTSNNLKLVIQK